MRDGMGAAGADGQDGSQAVTVHGRTPAHAVLDRGQGEGEKVGDLLEGALLEKSELGDESKVVGQLGERELDELCILAVDRQTAGGRRSGRVKRRKVVTVVASEYSDVSAATFGGVVPISGIADAVVDDGEEPGSKASLAAPFHGGSCLPCPEQGFLEDVLAGCAGGEITHARFDDHDKRGRVAALHRGGPVLGIDQIWRRDGRGQGRRKFVLVVEVDWHVRLAHFAIIPGPAWLFR